ncbi:hypothetical protein AA18890_1045 [Komagataeibacter europaeus LMG 18890]|nr:hypothetical protein AA18890_1045 [Komagataeibacter europaeus LMG 18890]
MAHAGWTDPWMQTVRVVLPPVGSGVKPTACPDSAGADMYANLSMAAIHQAATITGTMHVTVWS